MFKFLKKSKLLTTLSLLSMASLTAVVVSTMAWFTDVRNFVPTDVSSSVITSYFDSGSGTQSDPFVITRPIHYWNLVYLQENNEMQINGVPFADATLYFQFGKKDADGITGTDDDDIYLFYEYDNNGVLQYESVDLESTSPILNMNYYQGDKAILPIGTTAHPFKGHIIGNNLTVSHLHINGNGLSDVGIFGYVAEGSTIRDAYYESPYIDVHVTNPSATSGTGHATHPTHSYIGYLAGHVYNASTSFTHVYVNNVQLENSEGNQNEMINTYGYFGHVDYPSTITADSASYSTQVSSRYAYNAIRDSYSAATSATVETRNVVQTPLSGTMYTSAMSTSDSGASYDMSTYTNGSTYPYSLSTIGYHTGDSVTEHIRYFDSDNVLTRLSTSAIEIDSKPTSWSTYDDGEYIYYDTDLNKWQYATVVSPVSPDPQWVTYNCMTISYTISDTTYYLKFSGTNSLAITTTAPADATSSELDDYYFVFKTSLTAKGLASLVEHGDSQTCYIYSPAHQMYLYATADSSQSAGTINFVSDGASATQFTILGPQSTLNFPIGTTANGVLIGSTTAVNSFRTNSQTESTVFDLGEVLERHSTEGATYDLVTNVSELADGDTIVLAGEKSTETYGMSTQQNANNRTGVSTTRVGDQLTYVTGLAELTLAYDSTTSRFTMYDATNHGYLYAAGTANSGKNWLRTISNLSDLSTPTWGNWTISINSAGAATIVSVGNAHTPYLMYNSLQQNGYYLFSCYHRQTVTNDLVIPEIFKRNQSSGATEKYSDAIVKQYESSSSSDEKTVHTYDLKTASLTVDNAENPNYYTGEPFAVQRGEGSSVVFNKTQSKVSYTATATSAHFRKVTSQAEVTDGSYLIVCEGSNLAFDGSLSTLDATSNTTSVTISSSKITTDVETLLTKSFTIAAVTGGYSIKSSKNYYIGRSAASNGLNSSLTYSADYLNTITISSGDATITGTGGCYLKYNSTSGQTRFRYYKSGMNSIQLYKYIPPQSVDTATYIGDLVGNRYDPDRIDVVGAAKFTEDYIEMNGQIENATTLTDSNIGQKFYTTSFAQNVVTLKVDVTGSKDLGTIFYTYLASSSSIPEFATGSTAVSFETLGARDVNANGENTTEHSYLLNLNTMNIKTMSFCALDESGNVYAIYNQDGTIKASATDFNEANIKSYILVIGNTGGTSIQIENVQYTFNSATGNVGNFGSVDYRSATYDENGDFTGSSDQVSSSIISIYYDITTEGHEFSITVSYDKDEKTYNITVVSSITTTINVFNYDANTYKVKVNGVEYLQGTNIVPISAS